MRAGEMRSRGISSLAGLLTALLLIASTAAAGPWRASEQNIPGWRLMTPDERIEHQRRMRGFKSYPQCLSYQAEHHTRMLKRAQQAGVSLLPRRQSGCDQLRKKGYLK